LKILIEDKKAVGVSFIRDNRKYSIMAKKEVIVSVGAIGSPQILMLSGIGPKDHLKSKGVWLDRVKKNSVTYDYCRRLEKTF
jgi:choline dehydrogenase